MIVYNTAAGGVAGVGATVGTLSPGFWYYENKSSTVIGGTWKPVSIASGTSGAVYSAGNGISISGNTISANDATASSNGIIRLGGHLSGSASAPQIADNVVGGSKIIDGSITTVDLADNAVSSDKIVNGSVSTVDLADNSVTIDKLGGINKSSGTFLRGDGIWTAVSGGSAYSGSTSVNLVGTEFQRAALLGDIVAAANSNTATIVNNAVNSSKIEDLSVNTADVADNAITINKIGGSGKSASTYLRGDGVWSTVAAGTTYSGSTSVVLSGTSFQRAALTGDIISSQNSNSTVIATDAVTSSKIDDGAVATVDIANNAVTIAKLPNGATSSTFLRGDGSWQTPAGDNFGNHIAAADIKLNDKTIYLRASGTTTDTNHGLNHNAGVDGPRLFGNNGGYLGTANGTNAVRWYTNGNVDISGQIKISGGSPGANKVLTSSSDGTASWSTPAATTVSANNGLSSVTGGLKLGGNLSEATTIGAGSNKFSITGSSSNVFDVDGGTLMVNAVDGRVGIGNTSPTYKLDVTGDARVTGTVFTAKVQGTSDMRFKKDIKKIEGASQKLSSLGGYTYIWKDKKDFPNQALGEGKDMGVIAQEVEKVFPSAVSTNKEGYKSVNYNALIPVMIEAINESNRKINELEKKLKDLNTQR